MKKPLQSPAVDPEIRIHGAHACQAVAARRPEDVRRVYITKDQVPAFGEFLRWCAQSRLAYHVVDDAEMEKITQTVHHGGVAFIVREPPPLTFGALLGRLRGEPQDRPRRLLYLDNVQNPHNLGAIVRVAAHFGAPAVLVAGDEAPISPAMIRTAEGGAEWVDVVSVPRGTSPLLRLRELGLALVATSSHGGRGLYDAPLPARVVVMMGSETHGLAPDLQALADHRVAVPGTGRVESLNVAAATAVLLGEHWRRHPPVGPPAHAGSRDMPDRTPAPRPPVAPERPRGPAPRGDEPAPRDRGDRPRDDRRAERPRDDRPRDDRPSDERPSGDRPRGPRPRPGTRS